MDGTVLSGIGSFYQIESNDTVYTCRAQKKLRKVAAPVPGDQVQFTPGSDGEDGWIEKIYPRRNVLIRPAVANVDILALVVAPVPEPDMLLAERLLLYARRAEITPAVIVNKQDLDTGLAERIRKEYSGSPLEVFSVSATEHIGIEPIREALTGKLTCFAGQSAVGKSSLLNALCGLELETGGLSRKTDRGRHTTRRAELLSAAGMRIIDTPGFSLLETMEMDPQEMPDYYPEYVSLSEQCRFQPCMHDREPGCAVRGQVEAGALSAVRYERYRTLLQEVRDTWKERYR